MRHESSITQKDRDGSTLLHLAAQIGDVNVIKQLLDQKLDINACNAESDTPCALAIKHGHSEAVKLLESHDSKITPHPSKPHKLGRHYLGLSSFTSSENKPILRNKSSLPQLFFSRRPVIQRNARPTLKNTILN